VNEVGAVIVTYHASLELLSDVLDAITPQVDCVFLIDNKSSDKVRDWISQQGPFRNVHITLLSENLGLAAAQNAGIHLARKQGCSHLVLLDQDSVPANDMVASLLDALRGLMQRGKKVAAVGPVAMDGKSLQPRPFIRIGWTGMRPVRCEEGGSESCVQVDFLMSSGMLLPLASLESVGGMDESLFVDNVDLDWCFRAAANGLGLYGVCNAKMLHNVGDGLYVSRLFVGRPIIRHAPVRLFYMTRNRILLYRRSYTPAAWILQDLFRLAIKFALFSIVVPPRLQNMRMMLAGMWAAIRGRGGKLS
jgi:rhamnosyltransferase